MTTINKQDTDNKKKSASSDKSPHFWWIMAIASLIIICLLAFIYTKRTANAVVIAEYISFASLVLSITLSVFAILYTYTSNSHILTQFEKINTAVTNMKDLVDKLTKVSDKIDANFTEITNKLNEIGADSKDIKAKVSNRQEPIDFDDFNGSL